MRYFQESEEAAFFGLPETGEQVEYYLCHAPARESIARRGRERCLASGDPLDDPTRKVVHWFDTRIRG